MPFHTAFVVVFLAMVVIRLYFHRKARTWRKGIVNAGPRWLPIAQIALSAAGFSTILVYILAPDRIAWAEVTLPFWLRWTGFGLAVASLVLLSWTNQALAENFSTVLRIRQGHTLITTGPYRYLRHPMYSVFVIMTIGFGLLTANLMLAGFLLGAVAVVMIFRTPLEEKMLVDHFGDHYRAYMQRTGRYLPKIFAYRRGLAST